MGASNHPVYGKFAKDWSIVKLSEITVQNGIQTGPFGSQLHKEDYQPVGTPIITVEHLGDNRILHRDLPLVSDADRNRLSRYWMQTGDIIFSRVGSVDRRALVRDEEDGWLFSGRCLRVRPDTKKVDPSFLSFLMGLEVFKEHIRRIAVGATMPSINTLILSEVDILLPPLAEQRRIAHILGTLDDKIELNRRMNATLEAIARALFKSWFVDFDPVHAKAAGRPSGLPPEIDALFPDSFADSELGPIPRGWEVGKLDDLVQEVIQRVKPTGEKDSSKYVALEDMPQKSICLTRYSKGSEVTSSIVAFKVDDILFGAMRPYFHKVVIAPFDGITRTTTLVLRAKLQHYRSYALLVLSDDKAVDYATQASEGTTIPYIRWHAFSNYKIVLPDASTASKFDTILNGFIASMNYNSKQSHVLASTRDIILPRLMQGMYAN